MKVFLSLLLLSLSTAALADPPTKDKPVRKPTFTIGKETTYLTGPLDKDGYIDYATALNDRFGKGVTSANNANVLIWKAIGPKPGGAKNRPAEFYRLMGMDEPPEKGSFVRLSVIVRDQGIADEELAARASEELATTTRQPWAAEDHPDVANWLKANVKPLALAREASKLPNFFSPLVPRVTDRGPQGLVSASLPGLGPCQSLGTALSARAMRRLGEGQIDEAWQDLLACHRLGRLVAQGGLMVESLVARRIDEGAARADLAILERSESDAKRLTRYLRDLPPMPSITARIDIGERFMFLDSVMQADRLGTGFIRELSGLPYAEGEERMPDGPLENIDWDPGLGYGNRWYDRLADATRGEDRAERERRFKMIETDLKDSFSGFARSNNLDKALRGTDLAPNARGDVLGHQVFRLLAPASWKLQQACDHHEQRFRNLRIAFALAIHQRETGAYPKTLAELTPTYLDKVPDDLFTGKPLVYRPVDKGFVLYSLGPNGKDDHGRGTDGDPKGDDIAIRIPVLPPAKK